MFKLTINSKYFTLLFLLILLIRLPTFFVGYNYNYQVSGDDLDYLYISNLSSYYQMSIMRPILYPFLIKLFNGNLNCIFILQFLISSLSWCYFISTLFQLNQNKNSKSFLLILISIIISGFFDYTIWDTKLLTESLSLSFEIIIFASMLRLIYQKKSLFLYIFSNIIYINIRDSNYIISLFFLLIILIWSSLSNKIKFMTGVIIILTSLIPNITSHIGHRQTINLEDNLYIRIINNNANYSWYMKHTKFPNIKAKFQLCRQSGINEYFCMPRTQPIFLSPRLLPFSCLNKNIKENICHKYKYMDQLLEYFNSDNAEKDYLKFTFSNFSFLFFNNGKDLGNIFFKFNDEYINLGGYNLLTTSNYYLFRVGHYFYLVITILTLIFSFVKCYYCLNKNLCKRESFIFLLTFFFIICFIWINFIGDAMEIYRHCICGVLFLPILALTFLNSTARLIKS